MIHLTHTTKATSAKDIERAWHVVDLKDQPLGRVATRIATLLQGKHKSKYTTHLDCGDFLVAVNAKYIKVTGNKSSQKEYTMYSGYPGGLKKEPYRSAIEKDPTFVIRHAVAGMLPKNKLKSRRLARLFIYNDVDHPHTDKIS